MGTLGTSTFLNVRSKVAGQSKPRGQQFTVSRLPYFVERMAWPREGKLWHLQWEAWLAEVVP